MTKPARERQIPAVPIALAIFAIYFLAWFFLPPRFNRDAYLAAIIDKHRALERASSPKIVFVGGSNLAFGIDSAAVSRAFGENVVNMGLSKLFGLRYQLEEVKDSIHAGDTVVIVSEYDNFRGETGGSSYLLNVPMLMPSAGKWVWRSYAYSPVGVWRLVCDWCGIVDGKWNWWRDGLAQVVQGRLRQWPATYRLTNPGEPVVFSRHGFTVFGDFRGQTCLPPAEKKYMGVVVDPIDSTIADVLNDFDAYARQRGASVVIMPPPLPDTIYRKHKEVFDSTYAFWLKNLHFPVVGTPERYLFAESSFYNSLYHLHGMSDIEEHTNRLIEDLSQHAQTAFHPRAGCVRL